MNKYEEAIKVLEEILEFIESYNDYKAIPYTAKNARRYINHIKETMIVLRAFSWGKKDDIQ